MSVVLIFEAPGVDARQYESVNQELMSTGAQPPEALRAHIAAPTTDGWTVIELWDSPEDAREFSNVLYPILRKCGIDVDKYPPRILPLHFAFAEEMKAPLPV